MADAPAPAAGLPSFTERYRREAALGFFRGAGLRRHAVIEASLRIHLPCSWVTLLTVRYGAVVEVVEQKPLGNGLLQSFVEIDPRGADPGEIERALRENADVADVQAIVQPRGRILATLQVRECHACQVLADSDCFLTDANATGEGGLEWHVLAPERSSVKGLVATLEGKGLAVELTGVRSVKAAGVLTSRQDAVIRLAYKLGYFQYPKKINLTALAKKLGVAKSTLSETLRAGEGKILHAYFHGQMKRAG
jgi:predicted DNA binding protein